MTTCLMGRTYTKNLFVFLKFILNWVFLYFYLLNLATPHRMALEMKEGHLSGICFLTLPFQGQRQGLGHLNTQTGKPKQTVSPCLPLGPVVLVCILWDAGVDSSLENPEAETQGEPRHTDRGGYSQLPWARVGGGAGRAGITPGAKWGDPRLRPAVGASPACDLSRST